MMFFFMRKKVLFKVRLFDCYEIISLTCEDSLDRRKKHRKTRQFSFTNCKHLPELASKQNSSPVNPTLTQFNFKQCIQHA